MLKRLLPLSTIVCIAGTAPPRTPDASYIIGDIQAHLFYQETGAFDIANVTSDASPTLWNTIIGEDSAKGPSGATLVLVKLNGSWLAGTHPPRLRVTVRVDSGGPVLLQQTVPLNALFTEQPSIWVPFIAFGTGCGVTLVSAALVDTRGTPLGALSKTIPFRCGE